MAIREARPAGDDPARARSLAWSGKFLMMRAAAGRPAGPAA
jgi:hypothetical protein